MTKWCCEAVQRERKRADGRAWRKGLDSDVGDGAALPLHLRGRSQSSQSRRVFSPSVSVKKAKKSVGDRDHVPKPQACALRQALVPLPPLRFPVVVKEETFR